MQDGSSLGRGREHGFATIVVKDATNIARGTTPEPMVDPAHFLAGTDMSEVHGAPAFTSDPSDGTAFSRHTCLPFPSVSPPPSHPVVHPLCTRRVDEVKERTSAFIPHLGAIVPSAHVHDGCHAADEDQDRVPRLTSVTIDTKPASVARRGTITRARSFSPRSSPLARRSLHVSEDADVAAEQPVPAPKSVRVGVCTRIAKRIKSISRRRRSRA